MSYDISNTYWNSNGNHQTQCDVLSDLIPASGSCRPDSPKLERLRLLTNLYYDLYNNGGCNMPNEIMAECGFTQGLFEDEYIPDEEAQACMRVIEERMDKAVDEAYTEAMI